MVGNTACGCENTFRKVKHTVFCPQLLSPRLCLCLSKAFVSKQKRFISYMSAFLFHIFCMYVSIVCASLLVFVCECRCVNAWVPVCMSVCVYGFMSLRVY